MELLIPVSEFMVNSRLKNIPRYFVECMECLERVCIEEEEKYDTFYTCRGAVHGNELKWYLCAIYSMIGLVIFGPAESAMPWVYCYLPTLLN